MRVLLVAGESEATRQLIAALRADLFAVDLASPTAVFESSLYRDYHVVVVDLDTPTLEACSLFRRFRRNDWSGAILALRTSSSVADRIAGLRAGADEFLNKPVETEEVVACIQALMRRGEAYSPVLRVADLELDPVRRLVRRGDSLIHLTPREFDLLELLVRNRERPLSRARIVRQVWNDTFDGLTNVVDVYITYLRRKIDDGWPVKLICTARGVGYLVREPERRGSAVTK